MMLIFEWVSTLIRSIKGAKVLQAWRSDNFEAEHGAVLSLRATFGYFGRPVHTELVGAGP